MGVGEQADVHERAQHVHGQCRAKSVHAPSVEPTRHHSRAEVHLSPESVLWAREVRAAAGVTTQSYCPTVGCDASCGWRVVSWRMGVPRVADSATAVADGGAERATTGGVTSWWPSRVGRQ